MLFIPSVHLSSANKKRIPKLTKTISSQQANYASKPNNKENEYKRSSFLKCPL